MLIKITPKESRGDSEEKTTNLISCQSVDKP